MGPPSWGPPQSRDHKLVEGRPGGPPTPFGALTSPTEGPYSSLSEHMQGAPR
ncbi:hypothetical protein Emag_000886 [Eimeria magna]